jgi:cytoskeletal protein CcmA (bactofilin family)
MKIASRISILFFFFFMPCSILAAASVNMDTSEAGNTYISGSDVKVATPVMADLLAAGGRVSIEHEVGADAAVAGGSVDVRAPVKQDLRVAAGTINIDANIGGELVAAGGTVRLENKATVAGAAWLAGSEVVVAGKIGKGAKIYANKIILSGEIDGNTRLYAQEINFMHGAKINGNLTYASPNPLEQGIAAQVLGTIKRDALPDGWTAKHRSMRALSWFHPIFILGMLAAGALLYQLFPAAVVGMQGAIKQYPLRSLLTGLALLFAVPPVAILFMATVIGIPIGIMLFALYPLMLLLGYLGAAFFIGRKAADAMKQPQQLRLTQQALFLLLALIFMSVLTWIPFLGGMILIAALVIGIGGWAVWMYIQYNGHKVSPN